MVRLALIIAYASAAISAAVYERQSTCTPGPVTINGRAGTIECDKDHSGGDYSNQVASTLDACANLCAADTKCLTAQHDAGAKRCYLKSVVNSVVSKPGINGIVFGAASSTKTSTSTTIVSVSSTTKVSSSTTTVSISSTPKTTTSTTTVSSSSTTKAPTTSPPSSTTSKTTTPISTTTTARACRPSTTYGHYDTFLDRTAAVQIHSDYAGSDYLQQYTGCESRCAELCAADSNCVVAVYAIERGYCYLKAKLNTPPVLGKAVISFVFYNDTTLYNPSNPICARSAPPNPWIADGGYEYGKFFNNFDSSPYATSGTFNTSILYDGESFEGCRVLKITPTSDGIRRLSFGVQYQWVEPGKTYEVSLILGRPVNYYTAPYDQAPTLNLFAENQQILNSHKICGWFDSGHCPISPADRGRISGELIKAQFTVSQAPSTEIYLDIQWNSPSSDAILLDDIRLNLVGSGIVSSTTTTTTSIATPKPTTTTGACTAQYTTIAGRTAAVQCGVDYADGDLSTAPASSLDACAKLCAGNAQCQIAEYSSGSKQCNFKSTVNPPTHNATVDSIVFYNATAPNPCPSSAPPSPYLLNGGFEYDRLDEEGGGYGISGNPKFYPQTDWVFEGCKAFQMYISNDDSAKHLGSFSIAYQGLIVGQPYDLTFILGRPGPWISTDKSPVFEFIYENQVIFSSLVCGFADTPACTFQGQAYDGNGRPTVAEKYTQQFTAAEASGKLYVRAEWFGSSRDLIILDDIGIMPAY